MAISYFWFPKEWNKGLMGSIFARVIHFYYCMAKVWSSCCLWNKSETRYAWMLNKDYYFFAEQKFTKKTRNLTYSFIPTVWRNELEILLIRYEAGFTSLEITRVSKTLHSGQIGWQNPFWYSLILKLFWTFWMLLDIER